ncbi:MAG: N-6 DNA methylase [Proteobacteria bacterium]|nr:N-6 DNA methylase [Pseudomonadota bacterium]
MKIIKKKLKALIAQSLDNHEETQALLQIHADALHHSKDIDFLVDLNRQFDFAIDHPGKNTTNGEAQRYVARKDSGAFYTPDDIVRFLARSCIVEPLNAYPPREAYKRLKNLKILDPAMGTGAFLIRALECMVQAGKRLSIKIRHQDITSNLLNHLYNHNIIISHSKTTNAVKRKRQSLQNISNFLLQHYAMHCIYGIDKNNRAVQIVRQTFKHIANTKAEQFLSHFACGNAIASPLFCHLNIDLNSPHINPVNIKEWFIQHQWQFLKDDFNEKGVFAPFQIEKAFPDVFSAHAYGFDIILMNPPWNKLVLNRRAWYRSFLDESKYKNRFERAEAVKLLEADLEPKWLQFEHENTELRKRIIQTSARKMCGLDAHISGHIDAYAMFLERAWLLTKTGGYIGAVLPNAFYANHGTAPERMLMFEHARPHFLFGFNNTKRIFRDVASGMRFCLLKTEKCTVVNPLVETGFGYTSVHELKAARHHHQTQICPAEISLGKHGAIVAEITDHAETQRLAQLEMNADNFGHYMDHHHISLGQEINVTICANYILDAAVFCPSHADARLEPLHTQLAQKGLLVFHEKGSFAAYNAGIKDNVRFLFNYQQFILDGKSQQRISGMNHYRIACRSTIHAAESEKSVFALLPPQCVVANSALVETRPHNRELKYALAMMAVANTKLLNTIARQYINTNLKLFLIRQLPFPKLSENDIDQLAAAALKLSVPACLFEPLFDEYHIKPAETFERTSLMNEIESLVRTRFGLRQE